MTGARRRVAVVTLDRLAEQMAGPAIRAWEISSYLAPDHDVRLVTFAECTRAGDGFRTERIGVPDFREVVDWAEVVILQGYVAATFPWLREADVVLVVDLYDPFHIESLEVQRDHDLAARDASLASALRELDAQVSRGDVFLCASARQRDLWIGHLAAAGRINPLTYDADPGLAELVRLVPFGISDVAPRRVAPAIKGVVPGIGEDDLVLLWGGGVYNWFDPLTLVRAVDRVRERVPNVRLLFLGMRHPNPDVPEMRVARELRALTDELGLLGTHVFFNEEWVPYDRRVDYLLDADVGVTCHLPGIETEFSFRTRVLDYLWAGLPIVGTDGDAFAPLVESERLGRTVPARDVDALADALAEVLLDGEERARTSERVRAVAERFTWSRVLEPVGAVCADPRRAPDAARLASVPGPGGRAEVPGPWVGRLRLAAGTTVRHLRSGGVRHTARKVVARLQRRRAAR